MSPWTSSKTTSTRFVLPKGAGAAGMPKTPSDSRERAAPSAKAPLEEAPVGLVERLLRFFAPLWGWSFIVWCLTTTCVNGNIIPVFLLFFVRPLFPRLHERFLSNQASWGWGSIADFTQLQGRLRPRITGTCDARSLELLRSGNAMLLSNHVDATDGLALFVLAQRCGRLGSLRFFAKHELLFVPVLGHSPPCAQPAAPPARCAAPRGSA